MNPQRHTRLSGLEPLVITPELLFVNTGTGGVTSCCHGFARMNTDRAKNLEVAFSARCFCLIRVHPCSSVAKKAFP
ncbi:MAG: hypothetical protein L0H23_05075 [Luteimonas sp.]|nr:hypothetical protein [Luteimonas sp.]